MIKHRVTKFDGSKDPSEFTSSNNNLFTLKNENIIFCETLTSD